MTKRERSYNSYSLPPSSYTKRDGEATASRARVKELDALLNSKDATLATTLSEKRGLEANLADAHGRLQEVHYLIIFSAKILSGWE